ncbi:hypothetical protein RRM29_003692 [Salmonella enterica]|nr:hypothetical protein [Salmonella enterica]EDR5597103.1 hypothetical protein [Salmonella enterica subsp. diarizonae]EBK3635499.1 hypothetical protein [Salmonella enterica]EGW0492141.1 hypothetical protein [Salmonella enterica]EIF8219180.1 hypothetical protein [Salmonella enterica]
MWLSTTELAKKEGVTTQTIGRYIEVGRYKEVKQTLTGHYRIKVQTERRTICYARVSSNKQHSFLENQIHFINSIRFLRGTFLFSHFIMTK